MKNKAELNALRGEVEDMNKKLAELSEEELNHVTGGFLPILFTSVVQDGIRPGVEYSSGNINWESDKLPTEPGSYKLGMDVDINGKWIPDPGQTSFS